MSSMSVSGVSPYSQSVPAQGAAPVQEEQKALADALKEQEEDQKTLAEMMQEAQEKAEKQKDQFKLPKNSRRYGDTAIIAYSKLARARSLGEVDAASGYARRQIAQLRAAKGSDSENAERIQAAINQLQKAVNRAGRKKGSSPRKSCAPSARPGWRGRSESGRPAACATSSGAGRPCG